MRKLCPKRPNFKALLLALLCLFQSNVSPGYAHAVSSDSRTLDNPEKLETCSSITVTTLSSNAPICNLTDLYLYAEGDDPNTTYQWTGPAGFSSTEQNPILPAANIYNAGTYSCIVKADGVWSEPTTIEIVVNELPRLVPTNNAGICNGDLEIFANPYAGTAPYTFSWTGPNGYTSNGENITIANPDSNNNGLYSVTVTDNLGCTNAATTEVTLFDTTPTGPIITSNSMVCPYAELVVSTIQISDPSVNYEWTGPNGTSTSNGDYPNGPIIINNDASNANQGYYDVTITIDGCTSFTSESHNVGVYPAPGVNPTKLILGPAGDCVGPENTVRLYSNPYAGTGFFTHFYWEGPNGATYNTQNITFDSFDASLLGTYSVFTIDSYGCESIVESVVLDFAAVPPSPTFLLDGGVSGNSFCHGEQLILMAEEIAGTNVTYNWTFDGQPLINNSNTLIIDDVTESNEGIYALSIDADGCISEGSEIEIFIENEIEIIFADNNYELDCNSNGNTSVDLSAGISGGSGSYTYSWTGPNDFNSSDANPTLINPETANEGTYSLSVSDSLGCSSVTTTAEVTFTFPPEVPVISSVGNTCESGTVQLQINTYVGNSVVYTWVGPDGLISNNSNSLILNNAAAGDYTVSVDVEGCSLNSATYELILSSHPQVSIVDPGSIVCASDSEDLLLDATVVNGTGAYEFEWTGPNGFSSILEDPTLTNINEANSGDYTLIVTDENGCESDPASISFEVSAQIEQPIISALSQLCDGVDVQIAVQDYSGTDVTYTWTGPNGPISNNSNVLTLVDATEGDYVVAVEVDGCGLSSIAYDLSLSNQPQVSIADIGSIICASANQNLILDASATNGSENYSYIWTGPNGFSSTQEDPVLSDIDATTSGDYTLVVTDGNGCESDPVVVAFEVSDEIDQPVISANNQLCIGEDVQLSVQNYFGTNVVYNWTGPNGPISNNNNELMLSALSLNDNGTYSVTVEIDDCASTSGIFDVQVAQLPTALLDNSGVLCAASLSDLVLSANPAGGLPPYTYQWTGPNGFTSNDANPVIPNASTSNIGTYTLVLSDANACSSLSLTTDVLMDDPLEAPGIGGVTELCEGEVLTLITDTNYLGNVISYDWKTPNGIITTMVPTLVINSIDPSYDGIFSLEVNVDGCLSLESVAYPVEITATPEAPQLSAQQGICEGDIFQLTTSTIADTYEWTGPNGFTSSIAIPSVTNEMSNLEAGTYTLIVYENNCVSPMSSTEVNVNITPTTPTLNNLTPICHGEDIELSATTGSPGSTYYWIGPGGMTATLGNPLLMTSTSTNNIPITNSAYESGEWSVMLSDQNGCSSEMSIPHLQEIISLEMTPVADNNGPVCQGQSLQLLGQSTGIVDYRWYDGDPYASPAGSLISIEQNPVVGNLNAGSYEFWLELESQGCKSATMASTTVVIESAPIISSASNDGPYCIGESIQLYGPVLTGATYTWSGPNDFVSTEKDPVIASSTMMQAGTYSLIVSGSVCESAPTTTEVVINPDPAVPVVNNSGPACVGGSIELMASNIVGANIIYQWSGPNGFNSDEPNPIITNADYDDAGAYTLMVMMDGCQSEMSVATNVTIGELLDASDVSTNSTVDDPLCMGGDILLFAEDLAGATYSWTGPNGFNSTLQSPVISSADSLSAGSYSLVVTLGDCESILQDVTTVYLQTPPEAPLAINSGPACEGSTVLLNVPVIVSGVTYTWYDASTNMAVATGPAFVLSNITLADTSSYYVIAEQMGCFSEPSVLTEVLVSEIPDENAFAGETVHLCDAFTANLEAYASIIGTGYWTTTSTSAVITSPTMPNTLVTDLETGAHEFIWTLSNGSCADYSSDTVLVLVSSTIDETADAGLDQQLCNVNSTNLAASPINLSEGMWSQSSIQSSLGVVIVDPLDPSTEILGFVPGNTYQFNWSLSAGSCINFDEDITLVTVEALPAIGAFAGEDIYHCGESLVELQAIQPQLATGEWTTISGATIMDAANAHTSVNNLDEGVNVFIWTLSTDSCLDIDADTIVVYSEPVPEALDDIVVVEMNTLLDSIEVLNNDQLNGMPYDLTLATGPAFGTVEITSNGLISYQPNTDYIGMDEFEYMLCNTNCPDNCDIATVRIEVQYEEEIDLDCFIPTAITPNNDGVNDELFINCLEHYPDNKIVIFNRWGNKVYHAEPYDNLWRGTFKGTPLPEGSYYYILELNDPAETVLKGYVVIKR